MIFKRLSDLILLYLDISSNALQSFPDLIFKAMKKVIVQDTNYDLLETMTIILEQASYEVLPVVHYRDVISTIRSFSPHVVLLDFRLSGEESAALCIIIKKNFPQIAVIALSCNLNIHLEYVKAGFDDYISKPFDIDHLFGVLQKFV